MVTNIESAAGSEFSGTESYLTNPSLEAAVNCALILQKPLLVRGEPGTENTACRSPLHRVRVRS